MQILHIESTLYSVCGCVREIWSCFVSVCWLRMNDIVHKGCTTVGMCPSRGISRLLQQEGVLI